MNVKFSGVMSLFYLVSSQSSRPAQMSQFKRDKLMPSTKPLATSSTTCFMITDLEMNVSNPPLAESQKTSPRTQHIVNLSVYQDRVHIGHFRLLVQFDQI